VSAARAPKPFARVDGKPTTDHLRATPDASPLLGYIVLTITGHRWTPDWDGELMDTREEADASLAEAHESLGPDRAILAEVFEVAPTP
jgi:hypothetical protein